MTLEADIERIIEEVHARTPLRFAPEGMAIHRRDLRECALAVLALRGNATPSAGLTARTLPALREEAEQMFLGAERLLLEEAGRRVGWNQGMMGRELGVSRQTIISRMKKHAMEERWNGSKP